MSVLYSSISFSDNRLVILPTVIHKYLYLVTVLYIVPQFWGCCSGQRKIQMLKIKLVTVSKSIDIQELLIGHNCSWLQSGCTRLVLPDTYFFFFLHKCPNFYFSTECVIFYFGCCECACVRAVFLPTGAPKAAETPAAAPADTKSRFSVSLLKYSKICKHGKKKTNTLVVTQLSCTQQKFSVWKFLRGWSEVLSIHLSTVSI